ncbi:polysaccharide deacetylase family protein [Rhizobium sp. S152]|uniref:polysaccharide deacetylase family protein n=1 Tax=Rhizobium sp. S152 TaxID=3055038 RepID=UPI0025AA2C2D|nr:polysaccharide deacetylase family protein [Rhizobium sp. S152]MDM9627334.1 polysaccharide deacetylase family protein [Rhizobium sp. S152]
MSRKRRLVSSSFLGALAVLTASFCVFQFSKSRTTQLFGEVFARLETEKPLVALTFDDGPSSRFTPEILEILKSRGVSATFFLIGREIEENRSAAQAIIEAGHEIGNHSYSHFNMTLMGPDTVAKEIELTDAAIRAAGYQGEIYFRPPYGKKLVSLPWYLSRHDRKTIMWDVEPESFPEIDGNADAITKYVLDNARSGSVIIMHVMYRSREPSRRALPRIIDGLQERGFRFATISELMAER